MKKRRVKVIKRNKGNQSKSTSKKNIILYALIIVFSCTLLFSAYKIYSIMSEYNEGTSTYSNLTEDVKSTDKQIDFDKLKSINPDIIGWIYSEGTVIDYPVVQGSDNDYYLRRLLDGSYNIAGTIFMDYKNSSDLSV